jgi:type I site-specific restriction-modification system R (restriction) subunit
MPQSTPEYIYVEKPTNDQLQSIGWQYIEGSWDNPQVTDRENFKQVLISDRLKAAIKRINLDDNGNPWLNDTQVNAAVSQLERLTSQRLMEANQAATELLLKGTTVLGQDGKQHTVHFIDFDPEQGALNNFLAINQYRVDPPWATGNRHASTLHANLLEALPNCVRIGFTGTPIETSARTNTRRIFGSFIDQYNIRQSQADGVTLPILYEGLEARGAVTSGDDLDQLFEIIFQDKSPEERAQIKAKYATKTQVSEARELTKAKARNMLRHYIERILPGGFKAQVVASTRLAAVRYQEAFLEAQHALVQQLQSRAAILASLNPETLESLDAETRFLALAFPHLDTIRRLEFATVISSDKNDDPSWKKWTDKSQQETHIERFKKPLEQDSLAILTVKSMLLTGFDAPLETTALISRLPSRFTITLISKMLGLIFANNCPNCATNISE